MFLIYLKDEDINTTSYNYFKSDEKNKLDVHTLFFDIKENKFVEDEVFSELLKMPIL